MIVNSQRRVRVDVSPLADFLERVRGELRFPKEGVTVRLVSNAEMARLNESFRGKRGPTDVLSFPANGRGGRKSKGVAEGEYVGDIAISPAVARRNARSLARSLPAELRILILHGMIHLAGYDHERDTGQMERLERRLRRKLGLE